MSIFDNLCFFPPHYEASAFTALFFNSSVPLSRITFISSVFDLPFLACALPILSCFLHSIFASMRRIYSLLSLVFSIFLSMCYMFNFKTCISILLILHVFLKLQMLPHNLFSCVHWCFTLLYN